MVDFQADEWRIIVWSHRSWHIRQPAPQSKLRELRQRARSACFVPMTAKSVSEVKPSVKRADFTDILISKTLVSVILGHRRHIESLWALRALTLTLGARINIMQHIYPLSMGTKVCMK